MNIFDSALAVPLALAALLASFVLSLAVAGIARRRRQSSERVVEEPNSHYTSQLARERESRHRWRAIALDRIHEINREEVVRLLAKADATSVEALRPNERAFLDHMAELARESLPPERRGSGARPPLELHERTA